jgi:predicted kinase
MDQAGIIHLVVGSTGAGKSTYARALSRDLGAARFAIDEWMETLFFADRPDDAGPDWYMNRIARATDMIWEMVTQLVPLGTSTVLEIGLTQRDARSQFYDRVTARDLSLKLHVVDAPREERWARVEGRNRDKGETYSMQVTRGMFDFVENMWEPPEPAELERWNGAIVRT